MLNNPFLGSVSSSSSMMAADSPGPAPSNPLGFIPRMLDLITGRQPQGSDLSSWLDKAAPHFREFWHEYNEEAKRATQEERDYQSREAEIAREWSERMSNTEVQRRMEDLAKAGINPLMAVTGQLAGGTPSASQAHRSPPRDVHGSNTGLHVLSMIINALTQLGSSGMRMFGSIL